MAIWLLIAVFAAEFFLFDQFGAHRVTGIYPRWNDQIQYLSEAYTGHEYARRHGLPAGLWHALTIPSAQGTLHAVAAVFDFQLVGASRSAALALNVLALIAWQAVLFVAVRRRSGADLLAFISALLPLALRGPWQDVPGSAYDFRLDHLAMCAIGVASATLLLADGMRSRTWSAIFGVATGVTLLTRFLTGTYFVLVFLGIGSWVMLGRDRRPRLVNVLLAVLIAALIAGPVFWMDREWVWNYYYIGHYVGPESAIRNQNFGLARSLQFVAEGLVERHLGAFFAFIAAVIAAGAIWARLRAGRRRASPASPVGEFAATGALFLFAPAIVLTLHPQKSDVVLSALVPGVVLLTIAAWLLIGAQAVFERPSGTSWRLIAAAAGLGAFAYFSTRQITPFDHAQLQADSRQAGAIADFIYRQTQADVATPRIAADYITDALDAQVMRVICYERHHVWRNFEMTLPTGIAEPDAGTVWQRITTSDFVLVSAADAPVGRYPFDRKLAGMRTAIRNWCDRHLRIAAQFPFAGHVVTLYERADLH